MTQFAESIVPLAWTQIWQIAVVALGAGALARLFCRRRPHLAYVLWLVVLVKCLTPPLWSSPAGVFSWAVGGSTLKQEVTERTEIGTPFGSEPQGRRLPLGGAPLRPSDPKGFSESDETPTRTIEKQESSTDFADSHRLTSDKNLRQSAKSADLESVKTASQFEVGSRSDGGVARDGLGKPSHDRTRADHNVATIICLIWLIGAALYATGVLWTLFRWRRIVRDSSKLIDESLAALAADLVRRLGIRRRVKVRVSSEPVGPFAFGWFRPIIVLPKALVATRPIDEIEPLLAHELAHIRRGDAFVGLLQIAAQGLSWFHPLVWWANRQLTRERERCCDEEVVAGLSLPPARYARGLLDALELEHRLRPLAALPGVRPLDITKQRLEHVMLHSSKFHKRPPRRHWLVLLAGFVLLAPAASLTPRVAGAGLKGSPGSQPNADSGEPQTAVSDGGQPAASGGAKSKPELVLQTGHGAEITHAVFSADGRFILSGADDGRAILWDAETGRLLRSFGKPGEDATGFRRTVAALSPDGKFVLTNGVAGYSKTPGQPGFLGLSTALILWDAATGEKVRTFKVEPSGDIQAIAFSPDGKQALAGDSEKCAVLYDTATGEEIRTFQGHAEINGVAFSPDGKLVATTGWQDNAAILWDIETGERLRPLSFKADRGLPPGTQVDDGLATSVSFRPDGKELLAGLKDNTAVSWSMETALRRTFQGHRGEATSVAFSPDGKQVLTGSMDGTSIIWDPATRRKTRVFRVDSAVTSVAFSPDGKRILTGAQDGSLAQWNAATGEKLRTLDATEPDDQILSIALTLDGKQLATCSRGDTATVWDVGTGRILHRFTLRSPTGPARNSPEYIVSTAIRPDGTRLLTGWVNPASFSGGGGGGFPQNIPKRPKVEMWDVATGAKIWSLDDSVPDSNVRGVKSLTFSPVGKHFLIGATSFNDRFAQLFDSATFQQITLIPNPKADSEAIAVAFGRDSNRVLTATSDGSVQLWDNSVRVPSAGGGSFPALVKRFDTGPVSVVSMVPGGKVVSPNVNTTDAMQVLTVSDDRTANLWEIATGKKLRSLAWPKEATRPIAFGPDWRRILFVAPDNALTLWDIQSGKQLARTVVANGGKDILTFTPDGLFDGSDGGREKLMFRTDGRLTVVPAREFEKDFYRPGLLGALLRGDAPSSAGKK